MTASTDALEQQLVRDLTRLGDRLADDRLCSDLYAAIAGNALHPRDGDGRLSPSWGRAEELLNAAREAQGQPPLTDLAPEGDEGRLTDRAGEALTAMGWDARPRPDHAQDPGHTERPPEQHTQSPPPPEWERQAHAEADEELRRRR